ncbi:MAG: APC family permease [Nitrososphaeria archaeon]
MEAEKKVFVRKATGLVREIGPLVAILIVCSNVIGLGWQKRLFQFSATGTPETAYILGLPPVVMSFIIVGIIVLLTVWVFALLSAAMPRSGGGYIYISRLIHPFVGFVASWMEYFSIAVSFGLIGTAVYEAILIYGGLAKVDPGLLDFLGQPAVLMLGGMVIVVVFSVIALFGVKQFGNLMQVMFWIPLVITILLYVAMLSATPEVMTAGIEEVSGAAPEAFTQKALDLGMADTGVDYMTALSSATIGTYWAYIGFAASTFVAGEVKEATKNLPRALFVANIFIVLLYITISLVATRAATMVGKVGDYSFFSAYAYLSYGEHGNMLAEVSGTMPRAWMPNIAGFAAWGLGWNWLVMGVLVFAVLWVANDIPPFILTTSRIIFAMAFDRVMPERLADVSERWHTPTYAILLTMFVAFIGNMAESDIIADVPIIGGYINSGGGVVATDIWDAIFFVLAALSAVFFVWTAKGRSIYEKSAYKPNRALIGALGIIAAVANLYVLYLFYDGWKGIAEPWIFTLILIIVGAIIYFAYKSRGSRVGVDYSTIYAEIPPE